MERKPDISENIFPFKTEEKKVIQPKHFILFQFFVPNCLERHLLISREPITRLCPMQGLRHAASRLDIAWLC